MVPGATGKMRGVLMRSNRLADESSFSMFDLETPDMPVIDTSRCLAKVIDFTTAAGMVERYHYAHRVPSIVLAVGMFVDGVLAGCLTYGSSASPAVQAVCGEASRAVSIELNRLYVHDWAGRNSESWLVGQSFKIAQQVRPDIRVLVSYADTGAGHMGYIYQSTNWLYTGAVTAHDSEYVVNGRKTHARNLTAMGITAPGQWALDNGIERVKAQPKHRYVYFLGDKRQRREFRKLLRWPTMPYPKAATS